MTEATPCASQENVPSVRAVSPDQQDGEALSSPILPILPQQNCSKPRKAPTITPRSFTRFFTPKSTLERGGRIGASRRVLRDITASGANRKGRRTPTKDRIKLETCSGAADTSKAKKRKRYTPPSPDPSPDLSSPLKRIRKQSLYILGDDITDEELFQSDNEDKEATQSGHIHGAQNRHVDRIVHSKYQSHLGQRLRQETGGHVQQNWILNSSRSNAGSNDYQYETANFYTIPEDAHSCYNISTPSDHTIPFCTASCNSKLHYYLGIL